jgi:hypothetical protein
MSKPIKKVESLYFKMTHTELQQNIADLANINGWKVQFWWRSFHSAPGFLDMVICRPPRLIMAEIKIPPDKVKPDQQEWIDIWKQMSNIEVYVWTPKEWLDDSIINILKR